MEPIDPLGGKIAGHTQLSRAQLLGRSHERQVDVAARVRPSQGMRADRWRF
jgi:hypothetical protein